MRVAALALAVVAAAVTVAGPAARPASAATTGCQPVTADAVAQLFDQTVPGRLIQDRIPGLTVSVVSGGKTVFAKGYGLADTQRQTPMSASGSLVRIASITKLFTWTAVMQQVEAGRLDLNTDVNRYLKTFRIPATYAQPVTLQHLMDHTSGFEDRIIGTAARSAQDVAPLGEYLAANVPARIRPAGEVSAYSNYGAALAGYIVAEVSGEPYEQYIQRHLLDPLGMTQSTAAEPVPAALAGGLAHSYNSDAQPLRLVPFEFDRMMPDGSISATAEDMARFMTAHLNGNPALLKPESFSLMHQRSFAADPRLDGYAHGFKERTINGHRVLMHDGGWEGFISGLLLVPECDFGLFMSANATGGETTGGELIRAFFDRFTTPIAQSPTPNIAVGAAKPKAGFYSPTRRNETSVEHLFTLLGPLRLTVDSDATVHFGGKVWKQQPDGLYHQIGGTDRLAFHGGSAGRDYVITDGSTYQLLSTTESLPFNLGVLVVFILAALSALALPVAAVWRRIRRRPHRTSSTWRWARALTGAAALLGLGFLATLLITLTGNTSDFIYSAPAGFRLTLTLPIIMLAAFAAAVVYTATGWRGSAAGTMARIHQVYLLSGLAALAWFLWQWNLIGWWSA